MKIILSILVFILLSTSLFGQKDSFYIPYRKGNKWSVASEDGTILFKPKYEKTYPSVTNKIRFLKNDKFGFIDNSGNIVIQPIYTKATDFYFSVNNMYSFVSCEEKSFHIDLNGTLSEPIFGCGGSFSNLPNGLSVFEKNGKYGIVALGRDTIIQAIMKSVKNYNDGELFIAENFEKKFGIISSKRDTIYPFTLDSVVFERSISKYSVYKIYENGKVGIIDISGNIHAFPKYENLEAIYLDGLFTLIAYQGNKILGYIYKQKEFWE